jgi:murein DD-endopeptidase MepM/ murein hydrolase activator NlpD
MKRAPRIPSRWAGWTRSLTITVTLTAALGACTSMDNTFYGAREGTMEYPGSAAGPDAVPTYVVKNRDTLDGIARRYGVSPQSIAERNKLQAPYSLQPGQSLLVPGARYVAPTEPAETAVSPGVQNGPPSGPPGSVKKEALPPPSGAKESSPERTASAAPGPAATGEPTPLSRPAATAPPSGPTPRFQWPLRGKIITTYGESGGQKSDGIDIAADNGAPVKAADGGTVVYAGDGVPRLGNLLLVEHASGYITAYGNNDSLLVKKGDKVTKGETIARAGSSGGAASPRLHFEVRRGGAKTIDPMTVLPPG